MTPIHVLFLCTHNSARSILSEALLSHMGAGRFVAHSAGSSPRPHQQPHPLALQVLAAAGIPTLHLRSKIWDEFAQPGAPVMDLVITVCDSAAGEACPYWPGQPATAHWGYADPSAVPGSDDDRRAAFAHTLGLIQNRLQQLVSAPAHALQPRTLQATARALSTDMGTDMGSLVPAQQIKGLT